MIQLSDHFTYSKLIRFTLPSIAMMIFTSIYGVVDGFFVSNFVGKTPFTAVNFIMPFLMILGCIGFMFGTGGSALIAMMLGEGKCEKANSVFSFLIYFSILCGVILTVLGLILIHPLAVWLGAEGQLLEDSLTYGRLFLLATPAYILQYEFQCLFITAEKPKLGFYITVAAGLTNIMLDFLLVGIFPFGLRGAAAATALSQCVGGVIPLIYFSCPNTSLLRLTSASFDRQALFKTCINSSSELMTNISLSVVSMLYNVQLLNYAGEDGIAAYGVLMYIGFIFIGVFIGYSVGAAPVVSYHHGAQNSSELKNLRQKSLLLIGIFAVIMFVLAELFAVPLAQIFVGYDPHLLELTSHAFSIYSFSFLFSGFSIYGSSFFTALNDGLISAFISFLRTFIFQTAAVLIFPVIWGLDGIWLSVAGAEIAALFITVLFFIKKQNKYHY